MSDNSAFKKPNVGERIGMVLSNTIAAVIVLNVVFIFLGGKRIIEPPFAQWAAAHGAVEWNPLVLLTPGAAIGFGWLRYTLIMNGRLRGVSWTTGVLHGVMLALANVPLAGFLLGLLNENPLMGLLFGLASLLLMPSLLISMGTFGVLMGLFNAMKAEKFLARK